MRSLSLTLLTTLLFLPVMTLPACQATPDATSFADSFAVVTLHFES
ncbi:MAG: hypothetical protein P8N09_07560 [Planctomycetota bacterium]|jgi:hypothetical protein|nr:hypothetical protein [Planctomycetota bacterium]